MSIPEGFTLPQPASYLSVSEETVRRNIGAKRLKSLRMGTRWFIPRDVLLISANTCDSKTGQLRQMRSVLGPCVAVQLWVLQWRIGNANAR